MEEDQYILNLIKLSEITLTNKERVFLSKSNIKYSVDSCSSHLQLNNKLTANNISDFLSCLGNLVCPEEYSSFSQCMKDNKGNLDKCLTQFQHLEKIMRRKVNEGIYELDDNNMKL